MDAKKVVMGIEKVEEGLAEIKAGLLAEMEGTTAPEVEEAPKAKKGGKKSPKAEESDTPKKKTAKASTKAAKVEEEDEDEDGEDFENMKYNDLKALAVKRGMKSPNVSKSEIIAFLKGEDVDADDEEDVEPEAVENETDEEDLTAQVNELLADVDTEDIANFLTENGISAKGKRPSLIAKIVTAIEDGDLSLDDLVVEDEEDEEEEEAPKSKKGGKKAEKAEPKKNSAKKAKVEEPEEDEDEDESEDDDTVFGYTFDEDEEVYVNEDEENELLATVSVARMDALKEFLADTEKDLKKKSAKADLVAELEEFFGDDFNAKKDDILEFAGIKFLLMTDDDGEVHEAEDPYEINEIACCCGQALTETDDGYVCEICESEYDEE